MGRAGAQIRRYQQAVVDGDVDGARAAWPLLTRGDVSSGDPGRNALNFASLGLPPYHWLCRDVVMTEAALAQ
jgi:hypothetical protein